MTSLDARIKGSLPSGLPADAQGNPLPLPLPMLPTPTPTPTLTPTPTPPKLPTNPLDNAPSSPQQIYLNLLILEASLRSQYLTLCLRRRKYTFFLTLLVAWTIYFSYILFFVGPSPYYYIHLLQKLAFMGGVVTLGLFYLSGLYRKTMVFPRKFVGNTNKGLRQFNIKLVAVKLTFWERVQGWLIILPWSAWIFPYASSLPLTPPPPSPTIGASGPGRSSSSPTSSASSSPLLSLPSPSPSTPNPTMKKRRSSHLQTPSLSGSGYTTPTTSSSVPASRRGTPPPQTEIRPSSSYDEEFDSLQPSGSHVKLVILPKGFSPDFREGWELYRTEYWEKENERRAIVRAARKRRRIGKSGDGDEIAYGGEEKSHEARPTYLSHSRASSRASTPEPGSQADGTDTPRRPRRGSSSSTAVKRRSVVGAPGTANSASPIGSPSLERERGGSLTPGSQLRSSYLPDVASGDISDSGSVRSVLGTGSGREEGGGRGGGGRSEKKTRNKRGKTKSRGGGASSSKKKDVLADAKATGREVSPVSSSAGG